MRTMVTIGAIVFSAVALAIVGATWIIVAFGTAGLIVDIAALVSVVWLYLGVVRPWQVRWGATDAEASAAMPGDAIITDAGVTTRAVTIAAEPGEIWPWLVQIGYGRAGWYSYDWIDNDGRPSADRIIPEFQDLHEGDRIVMVPGMGPFVQHIEPHRLILAGDAIGGTWCLALEPGRDGATRLISRWRMPKARGLAARIWLTVADPGAFIMEQKMLRTIKARAERLATMRSAQVV